MRSVLSRGYGTILMKDTIKYYKNKTRTSTQQKKKRIHSVTSWSGDLFKCEDIA